MRLRLADIAAVGRVPLASCSPGALYYASLAQNGARIWTGHGILAHNLVKIAALAD